MADDDVGTVILKSAIELAGTAIGPGVGNLLAFLARAATPKPDDRERMEKCLIDAMRFEHRPQKMRWPSRLRSNRRLRRARRHAAKDAAVVGPLGNLALGAPQSQVAAPAASDDDFDRLPPLLGIAARELTEALDRTDPTTWTVHLANRLAAHASECLRVRTGDVAVAWARTVTNDSNANPEEAQGIDLVAWAETVALRFEVNMAQDYKLRAWVKRLDERDEQALRLAVLNVTRGIRTALILAAIALLLLLPPDIDALEHLF